MAVTEAIALPKDTLRYPRLPLGTVYEDPANTGSYRIVMALNSDGAPISYGSNYKPGEKLNPNDLIITVLDSDTPEVSRIGRIAGHVSRTNAIRAIFNYAKGLPQGLGEAVLSAAEKAWPKKPRP